MWQTDTQKHIIYYIKLRWYLVAREMTKIKNICFFILFTNLLQMTDRQTEITFFLSPVLVDHPVISQSLRILWNTYPSVSSINSLKRGNFCMPVSNKTSIKPYHKHIFIWIIKLKYQVTGKQTNKCTQLQESLKGNIPPRKYNK